MAIIEPMDMVFRLKFDAAIQDHVAKKATTKRAKLAAKEKAEELRKHARLIEQGNADSSRGLDDSDLTAKV